MSFAVLCETAKQVWGVGIHLAFSPPPHSPIPEMYSYNVSEQDSWQLDIGIIFVCDLLDRTNEGKSGSSCTLGKDNDLWNTCSHPVPFM